MPIRARRLNRMEWTSQSCFRQDRKGRLKSATPIVAGQECPAISVWRFWQLLPRLPRRLWHIYANNDDVRSVVQNEWKAREKRGAKTETPPRYGRRSERFNCEFKLGGQSVECSLTRQTIYKFSRPNGIGGILMFFEKAERNQRFNVAQNHTTIRATIDGRNFHG